MGHREPFRCPYRFGKKKQQLAPIWNFPQTPKVLRPVENYRAAMPCGRAGDLEFVRKVR